MPESVSRFASFSAYGFYRPLALTTGETDRSSIRQNPMEDEHEAHHGRHPQARGMAARRVARVPHQGEIRGRREAAPEEHEGDQRTGAGCRNEVRGTGTTRDSSWRTRSPICSAPS